MPALASFYGITIRMYFLQSEHNPPHIHAIYSDHAAAIDFMTDNVIDGHLPPKALELVKEWIAIHRAEIKMMWETQNIHKLPPLE